MLFQANKRWVWKVEIEMSGRDQGRTEVIPSMPLPVDQLLEDTFELSLLLRFMESRINGNPSSFVHVIFFLLFSH